MKPIIETQRLILRPWTIGDAADMYDYAKSPNVGPRAGWKPHENIEETKGLLKTFIEEDEIWAIIFKEDGKAIGSIGLHQRSMKGVDFDYELGYVLAEEYWGLGIMPEAGAAVLDYAFNTVHANVIMCAHFPFNTQSKRVIEKLGFYYHKHIEKYCKRYDGVELDEEIYLLTRAQYEEQKLFKNCVISENR